jgi:hypothetical protein
MKKIIYVILFCFSFIFVQNNLFAYDDDNVHPAINENAAFQSSIDAVLNTQLGFPEGIETQLYDGVRQIKVWEWLRQGGTDEDDDPRYIEHFHDPLQSWISAGLFHTNSSSVVWAQNPAQQFSWQAARSAYYSAISTGSETNFAQTFLILGHLMHLISDMAVPAHVRNDLHPLSPDVVQTLSILYPQVPWDWNSMRSSFYEDWAKEKCSNEGFCDSYYTGVGVDLSIFDNANPTTEDSTIASLPISALWDRNVYNYPTPDPSETQNSLVGLAEFTNANFLSDDTQFSGYPHPVYGDTNLYNLEWRNPEFIDAEDGTTDKRLYLKPHSA